MSKGKRDGRGKRVNGEILGRGTTKVRNGKIYAVTGGTEVGSAPRKRDAKEAANAQRRVEDKAILRAHAKADFD